MINGWIQLLERTELLDAVGACGDLHDAATIARLRRLADAPTVRMAIELTIARRKAIDKFDNAVNLLANAVGVEQSTSIDVARHKARRFSAAGIDTVADLCCGIGGDAMALREVAHVVCVDHDADKAAMARHNARCPAACADVTRLNLSGVAYHIDPDRRPGGRRAWRIEDCQPGPEFLRTLSGDGAMKLSPGVDFEQLPGGEVELISRRGSLVQAVLWQGRLARHERTATMIDGDNVVTLHGRPGSMPITRQQKYLFTVDPAVERAELLGTLCGQLNIGAIHPSLGLLTADAVIDNPWLTGFEVIDTMPWHPRKVQQALRALGAGIVEVKTRGKAVDPDVVSRQLRGGGDQMLTVFVLRLDRRLICNITRRC